MSELPSHDGTHHRRTNLLAMRAGRHDRLLELAVAAVLILLNGVFALSELAVVSARIARLKTMVDRARPGARAALALAEEPGRFLSTVQIGITLVGILAGAFSGAALSERFDTVLEGWGYQLPWQSPWPMFSSSERSPTSPWSLVSLSRKTSRLGTRKPSLASSRRPWL